MTTLMTVTENIASLAPFADGDWTGEWYDYMPRTGIIDERDAHKLRAAFSRKANGRVYVVHYREAAVAWYIENRKGWRLLDFTKGTRHSESLPTIHAALGIEE